jgi:hypothetical protein
VLVTLESKKNSVKFFTTVGPQRKENAFTLKIEKPVDLESLRMYLNRTHGYNFPVVNKILGDLLHDGVCYRCNGVMEE